MLVKEHNLLCVFSLFKEYSWFKYVFLSAKMDLMWNVKPIKVFILQLCILYFNLIICILYVACFYCLLLNLCANITVQSASKSHISPPNSIVESWNNFHTVEIYYWVLSVLAHQQRVLFYCLLLPAPYHPPPNTPWFLKGAKDQLFVTSFGWMLSSGEINVQRFSPLYSIIYIHIWTWSDRCAQPRFLSIMTLECNL